MPKIAATRREGYELLQDGAIELARVEQTGIRVDVRRLEWTKQKLEQKIEEVKTRIESSKIWRHWRKRYGLKANLGSRGQLAHVLERLGFEIEDKTQSGRAATGEEVLQNIDHPDIPDLLRLSKYQKAHGTFLKGIEREVVDGRLHPIFNLHFVRTFRSSSDHPNFQNFPVRDPEIAKVIRSLFIASKGCILVENDFKGIEVNVAACYHKDPNFISYLTTRGKDMHRDMAAQLYMLKAKDVSKDARYGAKSKFVFPQFYGSYYISCAPSLWEWVTKGRLRGPDGRSLFRHLKKEGVTKLGDCDPEKSPKEGTFELHVKEVEHDFWNRRFMRYGQWRREVYDEYLQRGYYDMLTGFRISGVMTRNELTNYPIQGSAFHCLLWSLVRINRLLRKRKMKSRVVGQIHDSLIGDVVEKELSEYLEIVEHVTTVELLKHYRWIIVPMQVEYEIVPRGGNWFQKVPVRFERGKFFHPKKEGKFTTDATAFLDAMN